MIKKIITIITLVTFLTTNIFFEVLSIKEINLFLNTYFSVGTAYAAVYCLPPNEGGQTPVFSQEIGYCTIPPLDVYGKCAPPYVYSVTHKTCILTPTCSGAEYWDANTKQCVAFSGSGNPGDTEPVFPDNSCAVDLNGNGEVEQNEIFQCVQTPQGYICPQGQTACVQQFSQPSCPSGYTYNSQTQKCESAVTVGVCSSQQVPITQYQCPTNGQIYSDLTTCNSNCMQTAQCTNSSITITGSASWPQNDEYLYFAGSGNIINFYSNGNFRGRLTFPSWVSVSGSVGTGTNNTTTYITASGNKISFSGRKGGGTLTFNTTDGRALIISENSFSLSLNNGTGYVWVVNNNSLRFYEDRFGTGGYVYFYTYTCPLGNYSCTGSPPTCTAGQTCVTHDSTVTKWQCSLDGVQYNTQDACTTNCHTACPTGGSYNPSTGKCEATATCPNGTLQPEGCFTGYGCPLGSQYQCHQVGGQWMCSPNECITQSQIQDEGDLIAQGLDDDGPRDENGNCLGTLYIFNGKALRCRKSGIQTGFHNCCNESQGKLYDSTGSTGLGSVTDAIKAIAAVQQAIKIGSIAYNAQIITIDLTNNTVKVLTGPGKVVTYSLNSAEGAAFANTALRYGTQTGDPSGLGTAFNMSNTPKDTLVGSTMNNYVENLGPQIASAVVQLAVSQLVKDPVLSSAINLVVTAILNPTPIGIAMGVVSLAMSLFMKRCDQQDILTSTLDDSKYCHKVGEYCVKKWSLIGCVQKAKSFCCFNSKLARIIHEQGRLQLPDRFGPNGGWTGIPGDPNFSVRKPNCRGFLPEEFQALDFNKIDLSEYIEDIQRNIRQNLEQNLQQQFNQTMQDLTGR